MFKHPASWFFGIITLLTGAAPLPAQARIEFGPLVALYAPAGAFQPAPYYSTALPNSPSDLSGVAWGGQSRIWFSPRAGVQLQVSSASSTVGGGNTPGGSFPGRPARVLMASAQFLWAFPASHHNLQVWLSGGGGVIRHGGTAYERYGSPVQLGTALGFGAALPLGNHLVANLGMTTLLYNIDVSDSTGTSLEHGLQVDPLIHAGVSLRWP
jgi:hypothetical protein